MKLPDRNAHNGRGSAATNASWKSPSQTFCAWSSSQPLQERASGRKSIPAPGTRFWPVVLTTTAHGSKGTAAFGSLKNSTSRKTGKAPSADRICRRR
jgi:hypothetical protein